MNWIWTVPVKFRERSHNTRKGKFTSFTCLQSRTYTVCYVVILSCSWEARVLSREEKCHLHRLPTSVKFIQTCWLWHCITFSHHTMHTKANDSRHSDKDLTDPKFVHLQCAGRGPEDHSSFCIDIVRPFRAPRHLGFLYYRVGWLCSNQWGSPTTGAWAFST